MKRMAFRFFAVWMMLLAGVTMRAEDPATLPVPTSYVNDFAQVLSPAGEQRIEDLARAAHTQAHAELVVVTVKSLDNGQSVEEFTEKLEEHWKLGKKGEDRSSILLLVLSPHKLRIETGYGFEGFLNDAKAGAILDQAKPYATAANYDQALMVAEQGIADEVGKDAGVTITPVVHTHHREGQRQTTQISGTARLIGGIAIVLVLLFLLKTGNLGWAFYLLSSLSGGGGGGGGYGGGRNDDDGGGFGGVGGGGSGGGGASRDF